MMNIKPDLDLNDGTYQILVSKTDNDVHLHDAGDEAEIYLSEDHFNKIAGLMGFVSISKLQELITKCNKAIEAGESVGSNVMAYEMFRDDLQKLINENSND